MIRLAALVLAVLAVSASDAGAQRTAYDCAHPPRSSPKRDHYPNGSDLVGCRQPDPQTEEWTIARPDVSKHGHGYPIHFHEGDVVTIHARGCVQGGGSGRTWRLYDRPRRRGAPPGLIVPDQQHSGLIDIPGVTPGWSVISHWADAPLVVTRETSLSLGFADDDYSDNGYSNHDDGVDDQCKNQPDAIVTVRIQHGPSPSLVCTKSLPRPTPPVTTLAEFARVQAVLSAVEVPLGDAISNDESAGGLVHFQRFRDKAQDPRQPGAVINSVEMHEDGCMDIAFTDILSPFWFPIDYAYDRSVGTWLDGALLVPQNRRARPWDAQIPLSYLNLESRNLTRVLTTVDGLGTETEDPTHLNWGSSALPAECGGPAAPGRMPAPRWIHLCAPKGIAPDQWTVADLKGLAPITPTLPAIKHSGATCGWMRAAGPHPLTPCSHIAAEWVPVKDEKQLTAEGVVVSSFMSGQDAIINHEAKPESAWLGTYQDVDLRNIAVPNCGAATDIEEPDQCLDWDTALRPDPGYRWMLAVNERPLRNRDHADNTSRVPVCSGEGDYRLGNSSAELRGSLGIEIEQWGLPVGYRPEPGDRAFVSGRFVVDCGHSDWHTELHAPRLITSSYVQTRASSSPTIGLTRNVPIVATDWAARTGGTPAAITKVVITGYWIDNEITFDVWPPARTAATSKLVWMREKPTSVHAIQGARIAKEIALPADNPNHVHVVVVRDHPGRQPDHRAYGQVKPDDDTRVVTAYMLWWN